MQVVSSQGLKGQAADRDDGGVYIVTDFFGGSGVAGPQGSADDGPQAFMVEARRAKPSEARESVIPPHFHHVRQFQVVIDGDQVTIGKQPIAPFDFHYADPSSPYGPFVAGKGGVRFLTLRPRSDRGAHYMPGSREKMRAHAGRNVVVPLQGHDAEGIETLLDMHEDGLAGFRLAIGPGVTTTGPDPSTGGGQYYLVMTGSLQFDGSLLPPVSLIWVNPTDGPLAVTAGDDGATVLVLQFPIAPDTEITELDIVAAGAGGHS